MPLWPWPLFGVVEMFCNRNAKLKIISFMHTFFGLQRNDIHGNEMIIIVTNFIFSVGIFTMLHHFKIYACIIYKIIKCRYLEFHI